jgi:hypothetical protein
MLCCSPGSPDPGLPSHPCLHTTVVCACGDAGIKRKERHAAWVYVHVQRCCVLVYADLYTFTNMYISAMYTISHYRLYATPIRYIPRLGDVCAPDWATGLDERGEMVFSEFRGTRFAGTAVRDGSRTSRGIDVSREWSIYFFLF